MNGGNVLHLLALLVCIFAVLNASPLPEDETSSTDPPLDAMTTEPGSGNSTNSTTNDLYVIRAVVYEIGILTDADNSTDETTERHEEVNISFFDPPHKDNGLLDLSGIPQVTTSLDPASATLKSLDSGDKDESSTAHADS